MSARASLSEPVFPPLAINASLVRRILVGFIRNEVRKVGFEPLVLNLSGGGDSRLVAILPAEVWSGHSDETELGYQYRMIDQLLYYLVDQRYSIDEAERLGFQRSFVEQIVRRVRDNQYKRRLPVIAKLSSRTIDRDFRYPRDWGH